MSNDADSLQARHSSVRQSHRIICSRRIKLPDVLFSGRLGHGQGHAVSRVRQSGPFGGYAVTRVAGDTEQETAGHHRRSHPRV